MGSRGGRMRNKAFDIGVCEMQPVPVPCPEGNLCRAAPAAGLACTQRLLKASWLGITRGLAESGGHFKSCSIDSTD